MLVVSEVQLPVADDSETAYSVEPLQKREHDG